MQGSEFWRDAPNKRLSPMDAGASQDATDVPTQQERAYSAMYGIETEVPG